MSGGGERCTTPAASSDVGAGSVNITAEDIQAQPLQGGAAEPLLVDEGVYSIELVTGNVARVTRGKVEYDDGSAYEGQIRLGKRDGQGLMVYACCDEYEGDWVEDKRHGVGELRLHNGGCYRGEWKDNKMHGQGIEKFPDGGVYDGEFVNDKLHGRGRLVYSNGSVYDGEFLNGMRHGKGTMVIEPSKDKFEGTFENDKREGTAVLTYMTSGKIYECDWKEDVPGPLRLVGDLEPPPA